MKRSRVDDEPQAKRLRSAGHLLPVIQLFFYLTFFCHLDDTAPQPDEDDKELEEKEEDSDEEEEPAGDPPPSLDSFFEVCVLCVGLLLSPWLFGLQSQLEFCLDVPRVLTDIIVGYADFSGRRYTLRHMTDLLADNPNFPVGSNMWELRRQYTLVLYRHVQFIIPSAAFPVALWNDGDLFPDELPQDFHVGNHFFSFFDTVTRHPFHIPDMDPRVIFAEVAFLVYKFILELRGCFV